MMPNSPAMDNNGGGMYGQPGGGMQGGGMAAGIPQHFQQGGQAVAGIAKNMSWKVLFFLAACCTSAAALISLLDMIFSFKFAPFSFTTILFIMFFGFLMVVLDFPIPHPSPHLAMVRAHIYKFFLFLTRFTGRGAWYMFLGTMIFATLYDLKISPFFGVCLGGYVGILGLVTLVFGVRLSQKLDVVRQQLLMGDTGCPAHGYSMEGFNTLAMQVAKQGFTDDELTYIFNSLSFNPNNDGIINPEEYRMWLMPGKMEIV